MILSLIRASQVENWKVANGKVESRPVAAPIWEKFPYLDRYYGGIRTLTSFEQSRPEYPKLNEPIALTPISGQSTTETRNEKLEEQSRERDTPKSHSWDTYQSQIKDQHAQECFLDAAGQIRVPPVQYYQGRPAGFPQNVLGSYEILDLPEDVCFERYGRWGPYGYGYSVRSGGLGTGENGEKEGAAATWESIPKVDYRQVDWADIQRRCYQANAALYQPVSPRVSDDQGFFIDSSVSSKTHGRRAIDSEGVEPVHQVRPSSPAAIIEESVPESNSTTSGDPIIESPKLARTAIVVRCWDEYLFREDDIANLRAIITELSMVSAGRYDVHLLVQVKNDARYPIWADREAYQDRVRQAVPEEFWGLVTLWTETQMLSLYQGVYDLYARGPDLPVHGAYRGLSMAMQHFAYLHPEYEHFWQWEVDVRYVGHYHDLLTKLEGWAKTQPRKGLWERNSRFYFPDVHGSWEDFSQMVRVQTEMGTVGSDNVWKNLPGSGNKEPEKITRGDKSVWGPVRPADDNDWFEPGNDQVPPTSYERDHYEWGVGEEADYISLSPIFDPEGTTWGLRDDITGFRTQQLPRRANIMTTSRMSRRLLLSMHKMTAYKKQFAFPEMWPATVALHHGYKAVYVPHPVYVDRKWPVDFMAQTFNGGKDGSSGGSRTSLFGEREHNLHGLSWFYNSGFAPNLYRRWLGLKVNNDGGEEFETTEDLSKQGPGVGNMPGGEGRMCMPPMLLHPIKDVELPIEVPPEEPAEVGMSDPSA